MSQAHQGTSVQPALADLFAHYLTKQVSAQAAGLSDPALVDEVVPFEAAPVQPVEPRSAWEEAVAVVEFFHPAANAKMWSAPPDWPGLVQAHEPALALAFCLGNFPQLVRTLQPLLQSSDLTQLRPAEGRPVSAAALLTWTGQLVQKKQYPQTLLAVGALRLARQFDRAAELINQHRADVPSEWQAFWSNEVAALAWHRGQADEAASQWDTQAESIPVLFNRGMAALFLNHPAKARNSLTQAVAQLPETSAWHHLGQLYLTLAESRG